MVFNGQMIFKKFAIIGFLFCSATLFCPPEDQLQALIEEKLAIIFNLRVLVDLQTKTISDALRANDETSVSVAILKFKSNALNLLSNLPEDIYRNHSREAIYQALDAEIAGKGFTESVFNKIRFCPIPDEGGGGPGLVEELHTSPNFSLVEPPAATIPPASPLLTEGDLPSGPHNQLERSPSEPPPHPIDESARLVQLDEFIENAKKDLQAVFVKKIKPFPHTPKLSIEAYIRGDGDLKWGCGDFNEDLRIKKLRELPSQSHKYSTAEIYIIYHALNEEIIKKKLDFLSYTRLCFWSPDFGRIMSLTEEEYKERLKTLENSPNQSDPGIKPKTLHDPLCLQNIAALVCLASGGIGFLWSWWRNSKKDHKKAVHVKKSKIPMLLFGGLFIGSAGFLIFANR